VFLLDVLSALDADLAFMHLTANARTMTFTI